MIFGDGSAVVPLLVNEETSGLRQKQYSIDPRVIVCFGTPPFPSLPSVQIFRWHSAHQAVVRPPIVARSSVAPSRGHFPPRRQRYRKSQEAGGRPYFGPIIFSASRQSCFVFRKKISASSSLNVPALRPGWKRQRQRISSAIQLPTPGNRYCWSNTALSGLPLRRRK